MIYLDHAATTYVKDEVMAAMTPYFKDKFGNASSTYELGRINRTAIEASRVQIAKILGAESEKEIFFTSGGSESDNWAIKGSALANLRRGRHIITTKVEHHAVLETCKSLENMGFFVTYLNVDRYGMVNINELRKKIRRDTILISAIYGNNEIGTINPVEEIGALAHERGILFHTDAVQAVGQIKVNVSKINADMLSLSAHKFYGPKGVGVLYIKNGARVTNLINGGGQEMKRRAGTENVPGIIGMAKALELADINIQREGERLAGLRDYMAKRILSEIPKSHMNGHPAIRLPNNLSITFEGIDAIACMQALDFEGIACSGGSACSAGNSEASHVLLATGLSNKDSKSTLRFTFGEQNTFWQIDETVEKLKIIIEKLRKIV